MKPLHIAASPKIVAKHKHAPGVPIEVARDIIRGLVMPGGRVTQDDERLVADLERVTGIPIAELRGSPWTGYRSADGARRHRALDRRAGKGPV